MTDDPFHCASDMISGFTTTPPTLPGYGGKQKDRRNGCAQHGRAKARWGDHTL